MHEQSQKVEFFHSESSFGSESNLSDSRYADFTNELIADAENVLATLKKELQPTPALNNTDRIDYAIRRAQILHKDSIPEQMNYLKKLGAPENAHQAIGGAHRKMGKLLQDYERMGNDGVGYKEFYNAYGKEYGLKESSFKKKEHLEIEFDEAAIKPEYIQIAYGGERQKLRGATPRVFMAPSNKDDRETTALKEEVYQLKKALEDTRKKHDLERTNDRLAFERRLKVYLAGSSTNEEEKSLRSELAQQNDQLASLLSENKRLQELGEQKERVIQSIKAENASLKEQIVVLRKIDNSIDIMDSPHNKSYNSETNELSAEKRNQKKIKNLQQQNQLLRNQLKTQRQRLYRLQSDLTEQEKRELERNRKALEVKTKELQDIYAKYDQQQIELLALSHTAQSTVKTADFLKKENELFKSKLQKLQKLDKTGSSVPSSAELPIEPEKPMEVSRRNTNKIQVYEYEGEGIEGYPYYQSLTKEFRVRFKRSCFRDKELLYKANGIEVGVITNYQSPNKISILVHITNYTDSAFRQLRGKFINANENKIQGQEFQQESLPSNEQIKVPVSLTISQYPIGPLILLLECQTTEKKEEVRMLLPAHIFKTMTVEEREDRIANPTTLRLTPQRKICKQLNDLRAYLKVSKREGPIRINLFHEHTHTLLATDISQTKEGIEVAYEHREGNRKISEYFMRTLAFLLSK